MGHIRAILCTVTVVTILVFGSVFEENILPVVESQLPTTLKIIKLTTGGDDTFDFTITGPTSYNPSITTSGSGGIDAVKPTLAISSFSDTGDETQIFINADPVSDKGASGAIGNSITLTGEKITNLVTLGVWDSTTGNITAYIWSGITQNSTAEGSETIVAQSDTWDFASHGGGEFPPTNPNNYYHLMVFNFSIPVSLTGDYVIGYKWSNIDTSGNSIGSRDSLAGGNSIFRSDGCTVTEIGASDIWSSCHTELSSPIRNLSMDITIEEDVTNVDTGTGIQTSNLVIHHTFDSSEIEGGIGLNAGTLGGDANAYYLYDSATDDYTGDWYLSDFLLNNSALLNDAHINGFNSTTGTGTVVQLGNFHDRDQWNFLHDDMTNEYTISFWIKGNLDEEFPIPIISTFSETNGLVLSFDGGIPNLFIGQDDFEGADNISIDDAQFLGLSLPDDGNFHLITLSVEKSNVTSTAQACIDLTCDTVDRDEPFLTSGFADRPFTIGEDHDERAHAVPFKDGRSYSEFQMDDLCIWSNAILSSSERSTLYNSGNGQPCATIVEGGGMGIDGPISVDPGTYSIQETIPAGWSLTGATCNDGSSSFSVDTISGIVVNSGDNIECIFENEFVTSTDTDGDGIFDDVDTLPNTVSDDFSDVSLGGTSSGTIVTRGNQTLTITEEANPDGVRITADVSGGLLPAIINTCSGSSIINLSPGDDIVVSCGSVTIDVIDGQVDVIFITAQGVEAATTLTAGNSITFDNNLFTFVASPTNTQTIIIDIAGTLITLEPDSTISLAMLKIIVLTSAGDDTVDDTFDFTVTGPTSYNPSISTNLSIGTHGPIPVVPGTYSISESIPSGWIITNASCDDSGVSTFSVDTISGIPIGAGDNIECQFENEFVTSTDTDGDGIFDDVDTLPNTVSDDFSDVDLGGTTSGTITTRGNQTLTISEKANPEGIRIIADVSGGLLPAVVDTCGGISIIALSPGDNIVVTCSSVTIDVTNGPVEVTFVGSGGIEATSSLTAGNSITFDPDTLSFSVPPTNSDPVVVIVDGDQVILNPGQSANVLSPDMDSFIKQGELNTNEGANAMMRVRDNGNNRALVSFDQDEILAAAQERTLSSATLRLYIEENGNNWGPDGRTVDIHRLLDDWAQGNGFNDKPENMPLLQFNELKTRGDGMGVTWKCATDTEINNQQPNCNPEWNGATFSLTPTDTITIFKDNPPTGTIKTVGWIEFDVTADLEAFLSTEQNYGWIVKKTEEDTTGLVEFTSGESTTNIPELVLVFN